MNKPTIMTETQSLTEKLLPEDFVGRGTYPLTVLNLMYDDVADCQNLGDKFVPQHTEVTMPRNVAFEVADRNGWEGRIIKVNENIPMERTAKTEEDEAFNRRVRRAHRDLENILERGLEYRGYRYEVAFAGSGNIRNSAFILMEKEVRTKFINWALCGIDIRNNAMPINKLMAYIGLTMSASRPFTEVFEKKLSIRRVVVVKDHYKEIESICDVVDENGVHLAQNRKVEICTFDGYAMIRSSLVGNKTSTLRATAAGWKVLANACDFESWFKEAGVTEIVDMWGNGHAIEDVDLIVTASCFKFAKYCRDWAQYQSEFERLGHSFRVCVEEHPLRKKPLFYQGLQTLVAGDMTHAKALAEITKQQLNELCTPSGVHGFMPKGASDVCKLYPALVNEQWHKQIAISGYDKIRERSIGGRVPGITFNSFLAPDPIAFLQHVAGMEVVGCLKSGECCCADRKAVEGPVGIIRAPHLDHAWVLLNNVKGASCYMIGPTMYINVHDLTTIRLRADYDGDHVAWTQNLAIIFLALNTSKLLGNRAIDWNAPESEKVQITKKSVAAFFRSNTRGNQIGRYADAFTKFWAHMVDNISLTGSVSEDDHMAWCWFCWAGNVLIDAAKHGSAKVEIPPYVKPYFDMTLPLFAAHAKANTEHPITDTEYWLSKCGVTNGFGDMYAKTVAGIVSKKMPENIVADEFRYDILMGSRSVHAIKGLWNQGKYNSELGVREGKGFFNQLADIAGSEYKERIEGSESYLVKKAWDEERGKIERATLAEWCGERGVTLEEACDWITMKLFQASKHCEESKCFYHLFMTYYRIFSDMLVDNVKKNLAIDELEPAVVHDDEEDSESSEDFWQSFQYEDENVWLGQCDFE